MWSRDVEHPMQVVLDSPMRANREGELLDVRFDTRDVVTMRLAEPKPSAQSERVVSSSRFAVLRIAGIVA